MVQDFIEGANGYYVRRSAIRQFRIFEQQVPQATGAISMAGGTVTRQTKPTGTGKWRVIVTTGAGKEGEWTTIHIAASADEARAWVNEHIL